MATSKTRRPKRPAPSHTRAQRGETWLGGSFPMPAFVQEQGEPFRPEVVIWVSTDGFVVGHGIAPPGELASTARESFDTATRTPMHGPPRVPARLRVASPDLAATLRAHLGPSVDVEIAPTPELDGLAEQMLAFFASQPPDEPPTYLEGDLDAPTLASFFRAAASLYRKAPWKVIPNDTSILSLTIPSLDLHDRVVCVIGQLGESHAILLFATLADFEDYIEAAANLDPRGPPPRLAPVLSLSYERGADLDPALRKEIATHHWEVAGPRAYPVLSMMDADLVTRGPTPSELEVMEAAALALGELVEGKKKPLAKAFAGGAPVTAKVTVEGRKGPLEVVLRAPYPGWDG
jgi:hypothetical protein